MIFYYWKNLFYRTDRNRRILALGRIFYSSATIIPNLPSHFTLLGIESSCDDTSICLISNQGKIYYEKTVSQDDIHSIYRGVYPMLAGERHRKVLPELLNEMSQMLQLNNMNSQENTHKSHLSEKTSEGNFKNGIPPLSFIAATRGPGLASSLSVGWNGAKILSSYLNIPCLGIHHMEGHALMPRYFSFLSNLENGKSESDIQFPFLSLLISGGHTLLLLMKDIGQYQILGQTLDDAVGEALDKGGRSLDLPWSFKIGSGYGASLEKEAKKGNPLAFSFPLPLSKADAKIKHRFDFSFSGLKTSLLLKIDEIKKSNVSVEEKSDLPESIRADLAASYQKSVTDHLKRQLLNSIQYIQKEMTTLPLKSVVVSGGVAANSYIRSE